MSEEEKPSAGALGLESKEEEELAVSDEDSSQEEAAMSPISEQLLEYNNRKSSYNMLERLSNHPYFEEHDKIEYGTDTLKEVTVSGPSGLKEAQLKMISTEKDLRVAVKHLEKLSEIGVSVVTPEVVYGDGINYLTVSGDVIDYVIDGILLEEHLPLLAPIFVDPNITKVMSTASNVLFWLQQKNGLFVANLFDIGMVFRFIGDEGSDINKLLRTKFNIPMKGSRFVQIRNANMKDKIYTLRVKSRFNTYIFKRTKNAILKKHGVKGYLKIKHAMDDLCKLKYLEKVQIMDQAVLQDIRKYHEAQKTILPQLWAWRKSVAKAHNIRWSLVMEKRNFLNVLIALPIQPEVIGFYASSKYVDKDMHEVTRILKSCPRFRTFPYAADIYLPKESSKPERKPDRALKRPYQQDPALPKDRSKPEWKNPNQKRKFHRADFPPKFTPKQRRVQQFQPRQYGGSPMVHPSQVWDSSYSHQMSPNNIAGSFRNRASPSPPRQRPLYYPNQVSPFSNPNYSPGPQYPQSSFRGQGNRNNSGRSNYQHEEDNPDYDSEIAMIDQQIQMLQNELQMKSKKY